MQFMNRESELGELKNILALSQRKLFTTLISGPRRVGKTELVKQFCKDKEFLYFFVYKNKSSIGLLREFEAELKEKGVIDLEASLDDLDSFLKVLFKKCANCIIVFDEVQFMREIYPAFFSVLQKLIDENKEKPMHIIFLGSVIGLVKSVFEDLKSPLYGRIKSFINLKPMNHKEIRQFLSLLKYEKEEDFVQFYSVFGGFPKYYIAIEDYNLQGKPFLEVLEYLFFRKNAPFKNEVQSILSQEFGSGKSYYYDILEAIATGHTKLSQIASYVEKTPSGITSFIEDLMRYYEIIQRNEIVTEKLGKSRKTFYLIKSPLFKFWFKFIYPNLGDLEREQFGDIMDGVKLKINSFFSLGFETVCGEFLEGAKLPFKINRLGPWWGHYRDDEGRHELEIDLIALNEKNKEIMFCECKWQSDVDAKNVLMGLKQKSKYVEWNKGKRKEYYAVFAKSFKEKIKQPDLFLFDLKDIFS